MFAISVAAPAGASADLLYSQVGSGTNDLVSADVANNANDSQGADDFTVPPGQVWNLSSVDVFGGSLTGGMAGTDTANVFLYANSGTLPGSQLFQQNGITTGATATAAGQEIDFTAALTGPPALTPGDYWVSVQSSGPYRWAWEILNGGQQGNSAVWQNPGGGLGQGCPSYTPIHSCGVAATVGSDFFFRLNGTAANSNFSLGQPKLKSRYVINQPATFSGAGSAVVTDAASSGRAGRATARAKKNIKKATIAIAGAGTRNLPLKLTNNAKKKLKKGKTVKLRAVITFTATGGVPVSLNSKIKLIPRRSARPARIASAN